MNDNNLKQKYAEYYKMGKVNINNFINSLNKKEYKKLKELYEEVCQEEKEYLLEIEIYNRKLKKITDKEELKELEYSNDWNQKRLEFIKIKKDILQRELKECEKER